MISFITGISLIVFPMAFVFALSEDRKRNADDFLGCCYVAVAFTVLVDMMLLGVRLLFWGP